MSLIQTIKGKQLAARKAKLTSVASLLTTLIGEADMVGKNAGNREVSDQEVVAVIRKFIKNIDETIQVLGGPVDLSSTDALDAGRERVLLAMSERIVLETFLPKQMTQEVLSNHIREIHAGLLSQDGKADMGGIMKMLKIRFDGLYDGKLASTLIKKELS